MTNWQSNSLDRLTDVKRASNRDLKTIFDTLLLQKKCTKSDLARACGVSLSYMSPVTHGKYIPPLRMRLKIASFFEVDSCLIWEMPETSVPCSKKAKVKNGFLR